MMEDHDEVAAVVLDNGSRNCKVGFGGDDAPRAVFDSVVGRPKMPGITVGLDQKDVFIGEEALAKRGILRIDQPLERGQIKNWFDMEKVWHHALYSELKVTPEKHPILITEAPLTPKKAREQLTQILFEVFNIPCLYVAVQGLLALYSQGKTTGLVIDSGDGATHTIPIYDAYAIPHTVKTIPLAGSDVTKYMRDLLNASGHSFQTAADLEIVRDIKEKSSFIDLHNQYDSDSDITYEMPDGRKIAISRERCLAPELMFSPSLRDLDLPSLPDACLQSIASCDDQIRRDLLSNIILSGGNTMFEGLPEKLYGQLVEKQPGEKIGVNAPEERKFSVWLGGSILASLQSYQTMWISKKEYDEDGPSIVHKKCF